MTEFAIFSKIFLMTKRLKKIVITEVGDCVGYCPNVISQCFLRIISNNSSSSHRSNLYDNLSQRSKPVQFHKPHATLS